MTLGKLFDSSVLQFITCIRVVGDDNNIYLIVRVNDFMHIKF